MLKVDWPMRKRLFPIDCNWLMELLGVDLERLKTKISSLSPYSLVLIQDLLPKRLSRERERLFGWSDLRGERNQGRKRMFGLFGWPP